LPEPGPRQLRLRIKACGIRRTDLHPVDGEVIVRSQRAAGRGTAGARARRWPWSAPVGASPGADDAIDAAVLHIEATSL